jgi:hypothetical protein
LPTSGAPWHVGGLWSLWGFYDNIQHVFGIGKYLQMLCGADFSRYKLLIVKSKVDTVSARRHDGGWTDGRMPNGHNEHISYILGHCFLEIFQTVDERVIDYIQKSEKE